MREKLTEVAGKISNVFWQVCAFVKKIALIALGLFSLYWGIQIFAFVVKIPGQVLEFVLGSIVILGLACGGGYFLLRLRSAGKPNI
ncbi:MAG: hypothetical protein WC797_04895 [Candidatus Paceibacterota bacterium]